jgi:hypothetical protein
MPLCGFRDCAGRSSHAQPRPPQVLPRYQVPAHLEKVFQHVVNRTTAFIDARNVRVEAQGPNSANPLPPRVKVTEKQDDCAGHIFPPSMRTRMAKVNYEMNDNKARLLWPAILVFCYK